MLCTTEYSRIVPLENGEVRYQIRLLYLRGHQKHILKINKCCPDCGVTGQWSARVQKLHLLAEIARLHEGHQHPPELPPHQHPAGPPDLQGPERSHRHTQGEAHTAQPYTEVSYWQTLVPHLGRSDLQLCITHPLASFLQTQTRQSAPSCGHICLCQSRMLDLRDSEAVDSSHRLPVHNMVAEEYIFEDWFLAFLNF